MYWNRKAVTGKFDRLYYVETEKTVTERYAGFMYWSRKAVTGHFDGFIMSKPKKLRRTVCRLYVLEQKSRDRAV